MQRLLLRIGRSKATLQDVVKLYQAVQSLPGLLATVSASVSQSFRDKYQPGIAQLVSDFSNFCSMVESTLDLEALQSEGAFRLRATFDENLQVLAVGMSGQMRVIRAEHERAKEWAKKIDLEEKKGHGWVLKAGKAQEKNIGECAKKAKVELVEISATKSGFFFRTAKMEKAARQHAELQREYNRVQATLVEQLMEVVRGYAPAVELLAELLSDLDVFCALAHVATASPLPYVRPRLTPPATGNTVIKGARTVCCFLSFLTSVSSFSAGARHPCLEVGDGVFIPNDVSLVRGERELQIITGPNMGGKSTFIRTAALCVLMAQMGAFVPAVSAEISVSDAILCRVGAADSQVLLEVVFPFDCLTSSFFFLARRAECRPL